MEFSLTSEQAKRQRRVREWAEQSRILARWLDL